MKNIPIRQIYEPYLADQFSIKIIERSHEGEMVQELHRHDFFYLLVIKNGKGKHEIDFTMHDVGDQMVFFMRPGQVHQLSLKKGFTGFLLQFKPEFFDAQGHSVVALMRQASRKNFCEIDTDRFEKLANILSYIFNEFTERQDGHHDVIKASLHVFFIELLRQRRNKEKPITGINPYTQEKLDQFLGLLELNLKFYKQVAQYARLMNISVYQLASISKKLLGKTPSEIINENIILEAKRQLLATPSQVGQIAFHLGYEDVSYFIRFFKRHTGSSPEAYRQNLK